MDTESDVERKPERNGKKKTDEESYRQGDREK